MALSFYEIQLHMCVYVHCQCMSVYASEIDDAQSRYYSCIYKYQLVILNLIKRGIKHKMEGKRETNL